MNALGHVTGDRVSEQPRWGGSSIQGERGRQIVAEKAGSIRPAWQSAHHGAPRAYAASALIIRHHDVSAISASIRGIAIAVHLSSHRFHWLLP